MECCKLRKTSTWVFGCLLLIEINLEEGELTKKSSVNVGKDVGG